MCIDYKLIGARIKERRKNASVTQENLAEMLSVTVGYVSQIERGITKPNLEKLSEICVLLDCDLPYLLSGVILSQDNYLTDELNKKISSLSDIQKAVISGIIDVLIQNEYEPVRR